MVDHMLHFFEELVISDRYLLIVVHGLINLHVSLQHVLIVILILLSF